MEINLKNDEEDMDSKDYSMIPQEEILIKPDFYFDKLIQEKIESKQKEKNVNQLIYEDKSFDRAFNEVFDQKNDKIEEQIENDEENEPFFTKNKSGQISTQDTAQKEKIIAIEEEEEDGKYYPFSKGEGLSNTLKKIGLKGEYTPNRIIISPLNNKQGLSIFKTNVYYTDEKGKKKKQKKKRKLKSDDIKKKIKAKVHKTIKNIINQKLTDVHSQKFFVPFPQDFITNVTIEYNQKALKLTYEQLIEENDFTEKGERQGKTSLDKYTKNLDVLNYLKNNGDICKKSEFEKIKNMKYKDLLKAYFRSHEFEQSIIKLRNKNEEINYIEEYINNAINYVDFYGNNKRNIIKDNNNIKKELSNKKKGLKFKISYSKEYNGDNE